jgi:hypothetical protein
VEGRSLRIITSRMVETFSSRQAAGTNGKWMTIRPFIRCLAHHGRRRPPPLLRLRKAASTVIIINEKRRARRRRQLRHSAVSSLSRPGADRNHRL